MANHFTVTFDAQMNMRGIDGSLGKLKSQLQSLKLPDQIEKQSSKIIGNLEREISAFKTLSAKDITSAGDFKKLEQSFSKIKGHYKELQNLFSGTKGLKIADLEKFFPSDISKKVHQANEALKKYEQTIQRINSQRNNLQAQKNIASEKKGLVDEQRLKEEEGYLKRLEEISKRKEQIEAEINRRTTTGERAKRGATGDLGATKKSLTNELSALNKEAKQIEKIRQELSKKFDTSGFTKEIDKIDAALGKLDANSVGALNTLKSSLEQVDKIKFGNLPNSIEAVRNAIKNLSEGEAKKLSSVLDQAFKTVDTSKMTTNLKGLDQTMSQTRREVEIMDERFRDISSMKYRIGMLLSMDQAVRLFKRALSSSFETIKELDATMTETAVVTDFSVGDMWRQLPKYTKMANELGVVTNDAYKAATLYYQQGLNTNQVMAVSTETLKMARIAGIDAADATDYMTAALRGFNMEINEVSAQRVNDVYSELAASTASDTEELSIAMSKTASIASNANMEFETTSALLAQIIETTREAPETAGTAMKTIIARFSEVKELFSQGQLFGSDEEGEEININKIDAALKNVGISLKSFLRGEVGLDDILLELASKWDTLDLATQRYIATTAAGSRQQSRFLAMMSNYARTQELVDKAYNAEGAGQAQYEKTLESMETALNRLKNAWDQFAMGILNSDLAKGGITILTELLQGVNNLTSGLGGLGGAVAKLGLSIGALQIGRGIFDILVTKSRGEAVAKTFAGRNLQGIKSFGVNFGKNVRSQFNEGVKEGFNIRRAASDAFGEAPKAAEKDLRAQIARQYYAQTDKYTNMSKKERRRAIRRQAREDAREIAKEYNRTKGDERKANQVAQQRGLKPLDYGGAQLEKTASQALALSVAAGLAGGAMLKLGAALDDKGYEKSAAAFKTLGTSLLSVGTVLGSLAMALPGLTTLFPGLGAAIEKAGLTGLSGWLWVAGVAAAVAGLVYVGYRLNKAAKEKSLEGQMEQAQKDTDRLRSEAEQARSAYDELLNSKESYKDIQETVNNLAKGTSDWTRALLEANEQVVGLADKYPGLSKYLELGENGQLSISTEGWEYLEEAAQKGVRNAQIALMNSQIKQSELQQKADRKALLSEIGVGVGTEMGQTMGPTLGSDVQRGVSEDTYKKLETLVSPENFAKTFASKDSLGVQQLAQMFNKSTDEIWELRSDFSKYSTATAKRELEQLSYAKSMITASASQKTLDYEYFDKISNGLSKGLLGDSYKKRLSEEGARYSDVKGESFLNIAKDLGIEDALSGVQRTDLELAYATAKNIDLNTIKEAKLKIDQLTSGLAELSIGDSISEGIDTLTNSLKTLDPKSQRNLASLISGDLFDLTLSEVQELDVGGETGKLRKALGIHADGVMRALGYETFDGFAQGIEGNKDTLKSQYMKKSKQLATKMQKYSGDYFTSLEDVIASGMIPSGERQLIGKELQAEIASAKLAGYDFKQTVFGNVDLTNRTGIVFDKKTLEAYGDIAKQYSIPEGETVTVMGTFNNFGIDGKIPVAYTPVLDVDGKYTLLDEDTAANYVGKVIDRATDENGNFDAELAFKIDKEGIDGIHGLIAEIGDNAEKVSRQMHFAGSNGAFALLRKQLDPQNYYLEQTIQKLDESRIKYREMGIEYASMVDNVISSLEQTDNFDMISAGFQNFEEVISNLNSGLEIQQISDWINGITWENPIEGAYELAEGAKSANEGIKKIAQSMNEVRGNTYNAASQMEYFLKSDDFNGVKNDLQEIINAGKEITGADIVGLTGKYKNLDRMLKNTGTSASALGKIISKIESGEIKAENLTEPVLEAVKGVNAYADTVHVALKQISELPEGVDESQLTGLLGDYGSQIKDQLSKGLLYSDVIRTNLSNIYGKDWDKGITDNTSYLNKVNALTANINKNSKNTYDWWNKLFAGQDMQGNSVEGGAANLGFRINNGRFELDTDIGYDEILSRIQGQGFSELATNIMMADMQARNPEFAMLMRDSNYEAELGKALRSKLAQNEGKPVFSQGEIDTIASMWDKKPEQIIERLNANLAQQDGYSGQQIQVVQFNNTNANGKVTETSPTELVQQVAQAETKVPSYVSPEADLLAKTGTSALSQTQAADKGKKDAKAYAENFKTQVEGKGKLLDYDKIKEKAGSLGFTPAETEKFATGLSETIKQGYVKGGEEGMKEFTYKASNGEQRTVQIPAELTFEEGIALDQEKIKNEALAKEIATAMGEVEIKPTVDTEGISSLTGEIESAIQGADTTVTIKDTDATDVTKKIEAAAKAAKPVVKVDANTTAAAMKIWALKALIKPMVMAVTAVVTVVFNVKWPWGQKAKGVKKARGRDIGPSLTGEEGPELHQTKDGAYITGANGPAMDYVSKGDTIYTAEETKKILKNKPKAAFPRFEDGYTTNTNGGGSASWPGGASGTSTPSTTSNQAASNSKKTADNTKKAADDAEKWENSFDHLYNLTQDINAELRTREKLEKQYQRFLKERIPIGKTLAQISKSELYSLEQQRKLQEQMLEARKHDIIATEEEYKDYNQYAHYNWQDQTIEIDWDKINAVTDKDQGEKIEKYIDKLEEIQDQIQEAEDAIDKIYDDIQEIRERGEKASEDLQDKVLDALIDREQKKIDLQEETNRAINDAANDLHDAISRNIEKMRQDRENEKTKEDLAEKERRLAYLKTDTTGGNALEIKQLEKEIKEQREQFNDDLVDQALNNMQEQNEEAADQRQRQVDLLQGILKFQTEIGYFATRALEIVNAGTKDGIMTKDSELHQLLVDENKDYWEKSVGSRNRYLSDIAKLIAEKYAYDEFVESERNLKNGGYMTQMMKSTSAEEFRQAEEARNTYVNNHPEEGYATTGFSQAYEQGKINSIGYSPEEIYGKKDEENEFLIPGTGIDWQAKINEAIKNQNWEEAALYEGYRDLKISKLKADDPARASAKMTYGSQAATAYANATGSKTASGTYGKAKYQPASHGDLLLLDKAKGKYNSEYSGATETPGSGGYMDLMQKAIADGNFDLAYYYARLRDEKTSTTGKNYGEPDAFQYVYDIEKGYGDNLKKAQNYYQKGFDKGYADGENYMSLIENELSKSNPNWGQAFTYAGQRDSKLQNDPSAKQYSNGKEKETWNYVFKKWPKKFKTGGLVEGTGLAWLDGTPSRPEYVLNAGQTQAFLRLSDMVGNLTSGSNQQLGGDTYINVDINVDQIANDYDVERAAEKVKQIIYQDSMYRNVNRINFLK